MIDRIGITRAATFNEDFAAYRAGPAAVASDPSRSLPKATAKFSLRSDKLFFAGAFTWAKTASGTRSAPTSWDTPPGGSAHWPSF